MSSRSADGEARASIRREAERVIAAITSPAILRALLETRGRFDERSWAIGIEQGWTMIGIPEAFGGIGLGAVELGLVSEAAGGAAGGAMFLEAGFVVAQTILRHGDEAIRARWLPRIAGGTVIGAISYGGAGVDPLAADTGLAIDDGRLTGRRDAVVGGAVAGLAVLAVDRMPWLVDLGQPGIVRTPIDSFDNSRCVADLQFDRVPAVRLDMGDGGSAITSLLDLHAVLLAHQQIGGAGAMLAAMRDHALVRRAFGQPLGAFQSVKHRIAEAYVTIELARAGARAAVALIGTAEFPPAAASARLLATEAYEMAARDAIQLHGGIGVTWEADLHLHQRRARSLALELGPPLFWEDRLVSLLAGEGA